MIEIKREENKESNYKILLSAITEISQSEPNAIAVLAGTSALLFSMLDDVNWAGFYLLAAANSEEARKNGDRAELVVGPYQGNLACMRIPLGSGVCGTAVKSGKIIRVDDVHAFPGHIACDSASNSEIVLPIKKSGKIFGVLDIDSPKFSRFDDLDETYLSKITAVLSENF